MPIKLIKKKKKKKKYIVYLQDDQLGVVIEDSRWELLYLVVLQIPE